MHTCESNNFVQYIFHKDGLRELQPLKKKITVIIFLYYIDTVEYYTRYIENIPPWIKIEIYSSREEVLYKARKEYFPKRKQEIYFYLKENRGRDISALLVTARKSVLNSDYICFIHDKKENAAYLKEDTDRWIGNLWGNMLGSFAYINQVLSLFEKEEKLGILFPPNPIGEYLFHWYGDTWLANYENTKKLAKELDISVDLRKEEMPVGLGTVFWARTLALKKLFAREWKYEDFPEEPLPTDGSLNHAVERILEPVARDAGFKCGIVMTDEYASWLLSQVQGYSRTMFLQLARREHLFNMHQIENLDRRELELREYIARHEKNYIYGSGNYGRALCAFLCDRQFKITGFVITSYNGEEPVAEGLPVIEITKIKPDNGVGIIIGVSYEKRSQVEDKLKELGFKDYMYGY